MIESELEPESVKPKAWYQRVAAYVEGIAVVLILIIVRDRLGGWVEDRAWFSLLEIAVCYGVWRGGLWPGLVSLMVAAFLGTYLYMPPKYSLYVTTRGDAIGLLIFLILGFVIVGFGTAHHADRQRILEREREVRIANQRLSEANLQLDTALHRRMKDLEEIRRWAADEPT